MAKGEEQNGRAIEIRIRGLRFQIQNSKFKIEERSKKRSKEKIK